jgi:hypothetical protein
VSLIASGIEEGPLKTELMKLVPAPCVNQEKVAWVFNELKKAMRSKGSFIDMKQFLKK